MHLFLLQRVYGEHQDSFLRKLDLICIEYQRAVQSLLDLHINQQFGAKTQARSVPVSFGQ